MDKEMRASNCLNMQYELLKGMYFDDKKENENYIFCSSKVVDDEFWNIAYLKDKANKELLLQIENEFKSIDRNPSIYIGVDDFNHNENKSLLLSNGYKLNDTDVYMELVNHNNIVITAGAKVIETEQEYNDFMKVLSSAYNDTIENADENVYADSVTECYYKAVKNTMNSKEHLHIIVYDNNIPVSVATLNYVNGVGGINNVGTAQGYWNKGYGKQVMAYLINKFEELGGGRLTLSTEYQSKNQQFYEKLGFIKKYVIEQYIK
jgi:GNAT superfamily N-acetyltransferase